LSKPLGVQNITDLSSVVTPTLPATATRETCGALITAVDGGVRWTITGDDPSTSVGHVLPQLATLAVFSDVQSLKLIADDVGAKAYITYFQDGSSMPVPYGAGSAGAGGGGPASSVKVLDTAGTNLLSVDSSGRAAVAIADGASTTLGLRSDAAVTDWTLTASEMAFIKGVVKLLGAGLPLAFNADGSLKVGAPTVQHIIADTVPAVAPTSDWLAASWETSKISNGLTQLTPKFAKIVASASGATSIVSAVASKKIRLLYWEVMVSAAVNVKWQSHTTPTDLTGLYYFAANGGKEAAPIPTGRIETVAGEALDINLSGAVPVGGALSYLEV